MILVCVQTLFLLAKLTSKTQRDRIYIYMHVNTERQNTYVCMYIYNVCTHINMYM